MSDKIVNLLQQENVSLSEFSVRSLFVLQFRKKKQPIFFKKIKLVEIEM